MQNRLTWFMFGDKECKDDGHLFMVLAAFFTVSLMCVPNGVRLLIVFDGIWDITVGFILVVIGAAAVMGTVGSIRRMIYHFAYEHNSADEVES